MFEINTDKSVDLISRRKATNVSNSPITLVPVVSAMPGIERRITYSGRGLANSINCSKTCSRRLVNLISFCALYLTSSIIGEVFEMAE